VKISWKKVTLEARDFFCLTEWCARSGSLRGGSWQNETFRGLISSLHRGRLPKVLKKEQKFSPTGPDRRCGLSKTCGGGVRKKHVFVQGAENHEGLRKRNAEVSKKFAGSLRPLPNPREKRS